RRGPAHRFQLPTHRFQFVVDPIPFVQDLLRRIGIRASVVGDTPQALLLGRRTPAGPRMSFALEHFGRPLAYPVEVSLCPEEVSLCPAEVSLIGSQIADQSPRTLGGALAPFPPGLLQFFQFFQRSLSVWAPFPRDALQGCVDVD